MKRGYHLQCPEGPDFLTFSLSQALRVLAKRMGRPMAHITAKEAHDAGYSISQPDFTLKLAGGRHAK